MAVVLKFRKEGGEGVHLAKLLRGAQEALDLPLETIRQRANCSNGMVWNALHGKQLPGDSILAGLCDALDVDFEAAKEARELDREERALEKAARTFRELQRRVDKRRGQLAGSGKRKGTKKAI